MFKKILVPVDLQNPSFSDHALTIALAEANAQTTKSTLCIMSVLPGFNMPLVANFFPEDAMKKAVDDARVMLEDYVKNNNKKAGINISCFAGRSVNCSTAVISQSKSTPAFSA